MLAGTAETKSKHSSRANNHKLIKKFCHSNVGKNFFNNMVVDAWNSLTNEIIMSPSVSIFKFKKRL